MPFRHRRLLFQVRWRPGTEAPVRGRAVRLLLLPEKVGHHRWLLRKWTSCRVEVPGFIYGKLNVSAGDGGALRNLEGIKPHADGLDS